MSSSFVIVVQFVHSSNQLMKPYPVLILIFFCLFDLLQCRNIGRKKREGEEIDEESKESYLLPPYENSNPFPSGNRPLPGRDLSQLYPHFPFTHQFSSGVDVNPGTITYINANLKIPDLESGQIFDLNGKLRAGPSHTWVSYGHLLQPVNTLNVNPESLATMINDPEFKAARATAPIIPVAQLPTGWRPVHCKIPLCNPFVHSADMGVQIEPGDDGWFDGQIDFPFLKGPYAGKRFPVSGAMYAGTQPIFFVYGQHMSPVNPFQGAVSKPGQNLNPDANNNKQAALQPQPQPQPQPQHTSNIKAAGSSPFIFPPAGLPPLPPGTHL